MLPRYASRPSPGAIVDNGQTHFSVWAPKASTVELVLHPESAQRVETLSRNTEGYFTATLEHAPAGTRYGFRMDDGPLFPDPASRFQPDGVHGSSVVVDPSFAWSDQSWHGLPLEELVLYELHIGTFSDAGTYDGVRRKLGYLKDLGVTAIELLPVADFPGRWNWGYDHAALFAPSRAYGTPDDLRRLVDEAHAEGIAVFLDVIYNHLGPDGAYVAAFAPMFTDRHTTPWGPAINLDDTHSEGVRHFLLDNARYWFEEYHIDGFRLDAIQTIYDDSEPHFLAELASLACAVEGHERLLIAEDDRNLNKVILPQSAGGYGLDGMWTEDFNHTVRTVTAGTEGGMFEPYQELYAPELAYIINNGWYYDGKKTPDGQPLGTSADAIELQQCVVYIQNHDQVGNRPYGERLNHDIPLHLYRAVSALHLFLPHTPLLFMGQEWAASSPFQFFTDHHEELGRKVTAGRRREQKHVAGYDGPGPDPQDPATKRRSHLRWEEASSDRHARTLNLYRALLEIRPELAGDVVATPHGTHGLTVSRGATTLYIALKGDLTLPAKQAHRPILHTEEERFATEPTAPEISSDEIYFPRAAALLMESV